MTRFHNVVHIKANSNVSIASNGTITTKSLTQIRKQEYSQATTSLFLSDIIKTNKKDQQTASQNPHTHHKQNQTLNQ